MDQLTFPETLSDTSVAGTVAAALKIKSSQALATLELLDAGNTTPFITRYRKEATGGLDEVQIQAVADQAQALRSLHERKRDVLRLIADQGKLTRALADAIMSASALQAVDDLYLPYRPKRKTRASVARERGLEPLATMILTQARLSGPAEQALREAAQAFINDALGVASVEAALAGARDICAEAIMEDATVRGDVRRLYLRDSAVSAKLTVDAERVAEKDPRGVYRLYYDFREPITKMAPHRTLALNRAEREDVVRIGVDVAYERAAPLIRRVYPSDSRSPFARELEDAIADGYKRLLAPALEREARAELTRLAEEHAIKVFATNLRNLLLQPPLRGVAVLAIDPGFRTGCKVSVLDAQGALEESATIYPHEPQRRWDEAKSALKALIAHHHVGAIAIGNGTASRETEQLAAETIHDLEALGAPTGSVGYVIVSEAGASVYSASEVARQEFPTLDATQRGGISIGRRLQDPLAELVKIEPKAVGVGLYQHDVDQRELAAALDRVVVSCVNYAGVDVNVASAQALRYVAGVSPRVAEALVTWRTVNGGFKTRKDLLKASGFGPATFTQAAGFLKIAGGAEPLDNTFIHPESYDIARKALARMPETADGRASERVRSWRMLVGVGSGAAGFQAAVAALAQELGVGAPTLTDILENLEKPGLDPRESLPPPILRRDVLKIEDLAQGMILQGSVRNVVDFGAFIDIGVKHDGLVHVSEMSETFVRDPMTVVAVGQIVTVRVMSVDTSRGRIQLSMRGVG